MENSTSGVEGEKGEGSNGLRGQGYVQTKSAASWWLPKPNMLNEIVRMCVVDGGGSGCVVYCDDGKAKRWLRRSWQFICILEQRRGHPSVKERWTVQR